MAARRAAAHAGPWVSTSHRRSEPSAPRGKWLVAVGIVLLAFNLRASVGSLSVVFDIVNAELGMSRTVGGLVATLPVLCFAVVGMASGTVVRRLGLERSGLLLLTLVAAGLVLRATTSEVAVFVVGSVMALSAGAMGNVLMPPLAKHFFPDRVGLVSALGAAAVMCGGAVSALATVPLSRGLGGWRGALGVWAVLAGMALVPWLVLVVRGRRAAPSEQVVQVPLRVMLRSRVAWSLAATFGAQAAQAYTQFGWLPAILVDQGVGRSEAGAMLALISVVGIVLALVLPRMMRVVGDRAWLPWGFAVVNGAGWIGILVAPDTATWVWVGLMGVGAGAFTWTVTMVGLRARSRSGVTALSAFTQGLGYLIASVAPFATGLLRDVTSSWTIALLMLAASSMLIGVFGSVVSRSVMLEDELE